MWRSFDTEIWKVRNCDSFLFDSDSALHFPCVTLSLPLFFNHSSFQNLKPYYHIYIKKTNYYNLLNPPNQLLFLNFLNPWFLPPTKHTIELIKTEPCRR